MPIYSRSCPACGAIIRPEDIPYGDSFPCPACGEWLKHEMKYNAAIGVASLVIAASVTWNLGYRDWKLIVVVMFATVLLSAIGFVCHGVIAPSRFKRVQGASFDRATSLNLADKRKNEE
jgi:hypothetical protein